jgi:alpha-tubulin suppressor-like RCC1 family protein
VKGKRPALGRAGLLLVLLALSACGGGGGGADPVREPAPPGASVQTAPVITLQPEGQRVLAGQNAQFAVNANSATALSYQWLRDGAQIPGATQATYSMVATLPDDGARFSVSLTNPGGTVTSAAALLRVDAVAPTITVQPASLSVQPAQSAVFNVEAVGTGPLTYQWQRDGVPIQNATAASYTLASASAADAGARFTAQVSNAAGNVLSSAAVLTVLPPPVPPSIATFNGPGLLNRGDTATLTVIANGTSPLTYQWRRNGSAIAGATAESYQVVGVTLDDHLAAYSVVVSNSAGSASSAALVLRLAQPPVISGGHIRSVAASQTSGVLSWGANFYRYELGRNVALDFDPIAGSVAVPQSGGLTIQSVAVGYSHSLALRSDGTVWAWGSNFEGALGIGEYDSYPNPDAYVQPVQSHIPPGVVIRKIVAGLHFSIALDSTGKVWGWGSNSSFEAGILPGGGQSQLTNGWLSPTASALPSNIVDIAAGEAFALALDDDGNVWYWGSNRFGGFVANPPYILDLDLPASVRPISVFAGEHHAMLIDADGNAWAWGENDDGELGVGDTLPLWPVVTARKVQLTLPPGVVIVSMASGEDHTLFLTSDGAVYAAGLANNGVLGNGESLTTKIYKTPQRTLAIGPPNKRVVAISAGERHSLALISDGTVFAWGLNSVGELGDGTQVQPRDVPIPSIGVDLEP